MMKRNVLAVVVPALLAASAANAAEVYNKDGNKLDFYGRVHAGYYFSDADSGYASKGDQTYARLGFNGQTQINDVLTGYGRWEQQFYASRTEETEAKNGIQSSKTRYAFAGLKIKDFGSIDYGRNKGIAYDGIAFTDVLPEFGGDSGYTDSITGRISGVATYRNKNFFGQVDGLDFGLQYQAKNEGNTTSKQNGDGFGVSTQYTSPIGVGVVASFESVDRTDAQVADGHGDKAQAWATGLKYDANNVYVAATYGQYQNLTYAGSAFLDKTKVVEAVVQYAFDFGLKPGIAYVSAKGDNDAKGLSGDVVKYVSVNASYAFNKNFSANVEYIINLIDEDNNPYGKGTKDSVYTGVTYQF